MEEKLQKIQKMALCLLFSLKTPIRAKKRKIQEKCLKTVQKRTKTDKTLKISQKCLKNSKN